MYLTSLVQIILYVRYDILLLREGIITSFLLNNLLLHLVKNYILRLFIFNTSSIV